MKKLKFFLFAVMAVVMVSCKGNEPELRHLAGTWSEPYLVNVTVKSLTFCEDGILLYTDKPDTTWSTVITWGGDYARLHYDVKNNNIYVSGYYRQIKESKLDSTFFSFSSAYSIDNNILTIDSFAYDGGINSKFIKPLILHKQ